MPATTIGQAGLIFGVTAESGVGNNDWSIEKLTGDQNLYASDNHEPLQERLAFCKSA